MNKKLNHFFDQARSLTLTPAEKASIKLALVQEMEARPLWSPIRLFTRQRWFQFGAWALVLVAVVGSGLSASAEEALPGDWLYPVKVGLNERVRGSLNFSVASQAAWEAAKIARRLDEAEALATRGEFKPETQVALATSVERSSQSLERQFASDRKRDGPEDQDQIELTKADLSATLRAHERILQAVSHERRQPDQDEPQVETFISTIKKTREDLARHGEDQSNQTKQVASQKAQLDIAEQRVRSLRELVKQDQSTFNGKIADQLDQRLEAVTHALKSGQATRANGLVEETKILLEAKRQHHLSNLDLGL